MPSDGDGEASTVAGRALEWHSRGQRFDPAYLHQKQRSAVINREISMISRFFIFPKEEKAVRLIFSIKNENQEDRKMAKIRLQTTENMAEIFGDFLISRKTKGVADKTLESYSYHFHAISKHLDTTKEMAMLQKADLEEMIASMRDAGLAANTIQSFTRSLKSFFSWRSWERSGRSACRLPRPASAENTEGCGERRRKYTQLRRNRCPAP